MFLQQLYHELEIGSFFKTITTDSKITFDPHTVNRNTAVCYYDCTNYYFEIESPEDDYMDEVTGEIVKGFSKYGLSKQHQPAPLVPMGLFMDADGLPLSMNLTSGSDNEQTTAIPLEKQLIKIFQGKKFIYCADAGLGSLYIRNFISMGTLYAIHKKANKHVKNCCI